MEFKERIISLVRLKGPVIPSHINKAIGTDILIASAALGELVSRNELKVSNIKVGGTPLYYLAGQESKLQNFSHHLNEKDKRTYDLLKEKKILKDNQQQPLVRVSLRQIRDFAKPLQVNFDGRTEMFWKWYLTPDEEARQIIRGIIETFEVKKPEPKEPERIPEVKKPEPKEPERIPEVKEPVKQKQLIKAKEGKPPDFMSDIKNYLNNNRIQVVEETVIRKNADLEFIIKVPSAVGALTYFCKAKSKRKLTEGDLSSVFLQGQTKKLPVLFLTKGELTKKAKRVLDTEFKGLSVKMI